MKPLLVLDVHYLMHRAFHAAPDLSWQGKLTGAIYGFFKTLGALKDEFSSDRFAFCFEHPHLLRRDIYPDYKRKRRTVLAPGENRARLHLALQITELRKRLLPRVGLKNVFCEDGYESDDLMAALALDAKGETILVTSDSDMYQCLRPTVMIYSPQGKTLKTEAWFEKRYGIWPARWAVLKALTGCTGDGVPGIRGVGEVTALRYLQGELAHSSKPFQAITSHEGKAIVRRNRRLVELPFSGCPVPRVQADKVDERGWYAICDELGMKSIVGRPPTL